MPPGNRYWGKEKDNMARWQKLPPSRFDDFHRRFQGDSPQIFAVCRKCGGKCEYSKISTLLPGEAEYMASVLGKPLHEFQNRFLDRIRVQDDCFDVLKLVDPCPFLQDNFECGSRQCKVILCEMYPIVFEVNDGKVKYFLDEWCARAKQPEYEAYFRKTGIPALQDLDIPADWLDVVSAYDGLYFDYTRLERHRASLGIPVDSYATFPLEALLCFQLAGEEVVGHCRNTTDSEKS